MPFVKRAYSNDVICIYVREQIEDLQLSFSFELSYMT